MSHTTMGAEAAKSVSTRSPFSLPMFVTPENKTAVGAVVFVFAAILYLASNHLHFFEPRLLPMSPIDLAMPFVPWTVWIYVSEYLFFIIIYMLCKEVVNMNKYVYAVCSLQVVSVAIFWAWPTTYPRALFPLPDTLNKLTYWLFSTLRAGDSPANCCPSLHVSSVFLCSFLFLDEQKEKLPIFLGWAVAIGLSTLTTKQHYLIDVITGLLMAVLFHWIFYRKIGYRARGQGSDVRRGA